MGARRLKQWIDRPLIYKQQIEERLNIVDEFINHFIERDTLRNYLNQVYDIERLVGRVSYGNVNARDLIQLKHSISEIPNIKQLLSQLESDKITQFDELEPLDDLLEVLENSLVEEPPISVKDGGLFKTGFNQQLDEYLEDLVMVNLGLLNYKQEKENVQVLNLLKLVLTKCLVIL